MRSLYQYIIVFVAIALKENVRTATQAAPTIKLPAEWEPHQRTFMVWPQSVEIWDDLISDIRRDIARIAKDIVPFEPVVMLADPDQVKNAQSHLDPRVTVVGMEVDDLWARDTFPTFLTKLENGNESIIGTIFNFNGWGNKQIHENDGQVAKKVVDLYGMERRTATVVAEGGSFETDGKGTLFVTKSSIVNENRNNKTIDEIEMELKNVLGVRKIIWFDGVKGEDITDAHVDCLVRFVREGVVVLNRPFPGTPADVWSKSSDQARTVLQQSTDVDGKPFDIVELFEPDPDKIIIKGDETTFLSSYANFLIVNGAVIVPEFGDRDSDLRAQTVLQSLFANRTIVPVQISALASGGGGIHCATHDQPAVQ